MDINEATAKALQAVRAVSGLTFDELSAKSGVPVQTIYRIFGAKRDIKLPQLHALAQALGVTVVELMEDAERIKERSQRASAVYLATDNVSDDSVPLTADGEVDYTELTRRFDPEELGMAAYRDPNKHIESQTPAD